MRTTLAIDDGLLATAKHRAQQKNCTLGQLVETSLQAYLSAEIVDEAPPLLPVFRSAYRPGARAVVESPRALKEFLDDEDTEHLRSTGVL
ncbi:hypothetical protein Back2_11140 [Nocardioides baekrokdamisoli]|uniref:Uncharacterized protein n=1 Tax=Nocardioides baekrokdamisoli TaxID=1804624 RepID=A0A3G9ICZ3_9ACTN|nr:antitoxin [Nocardioides baekrokdamisoli]BBH16827.1 hypothetical protein Back2_11140 [Nocardioides baekrokdamisoli]